LHYAFKQELRLLAVIIKDYTDPDYEFQPEEGSRTAKQSDYSACDIIPVSDPNAATMSQRVVQYQAVIQMAQMAPDIYDLPQLHRNMLEVLGIKNAEKLIPLEEDMKPKDPVSENQEILRCEPVKAFQFQDHEAHIAVHMAMIQDPMIQKLIGQNPKAPQMQAALMAHIAEHTGFAYRQKIEQQLGMALPPQDEKLPPQIELALSGMMAQAAQQVLQQNQASAAQQQAAQQAQDPVVQMQQQELQLKAREVDIKEKKLQIDAAAQADRLHLDEKKLAVDAAAKADQLRNQAQGNNPELETMRAQYEMQANAQRHEQDMTAAAAQRQMAAQQHMQNLSHKEQVHAQNLSHQRAQAKARLEAANKPESNPQEKTDK